MGNFPTIVRQLSQIVGALGCIFGGLNSNLKCLDKEIVDTNSRHLVNNINATEEALANI
jgi:hypothetical protein